MSVRQVEKIDPWEGEVWQGLEVLELHINPPLREKRSGFRVVGTCSDGDEGEGEGE